MQTTEETIPTPDSLERSTLLLADHELCQRLVDGAQHLTNAITQFQGGLAARAVAVNSVTAPVLDSMEATLFDWSLRTGIFPEPRNGGYFLRTLKKCVPFELTINLRGIVWGWELRSGKSREEGGCPDSKSLLSLLNRLLPEVKS